MIRRPPRSTLFPYTDALPISERRRGPPWPPACWLARTPRSWRSSGPECRHEPARSEEHTSELQSRLHLVCRLLLEKKKKKRIRPTAVPQNFVSALAIQQRQGL